MQAVGPVQGQVPMQLPTGLHRHSALFDNQTVSRRVLGNRAGHPIDSGEIGLAAFQRRCAHANKDRVSAVDGILRGPKLKPPGSTIAIDQLREERLKKWQLPVLEPRQFLNIGFRAEYVVAKFRQARSGGKFRHNLRR